MRGLGPFAWRSVAARPARTSLTIAGIGLGVAVLAAALVTTAGIDEAVERTVTDVAGRADLTVTAFTEEGFASQSVSAAGAIEGVDVAAPSIERRTYLAPTLGGAGTDAPVAVLGIDPLLDPRVRDVEVVRGSALAQPDEPSALISETLAAASGLDLGDEIELYGAADAAPGAGRARIVGIVRGDGPVVGAAGRVVVLPILRAAELFAMPGATRIDLVLEPDASAGTSTGASADAVRAALPGAIPEPYVLSTPADLAASLRASTEEFRATMALVAAVALFSGAFLIFNTLSMTVTERMREVALLRAAGATRGQVARVVLLAALVLGVAGSLLGILLGLGLAWALGGFVHGAFGLRTAFEPQPAGLLLVLAIGLAVTLAAAIEPALRAGRISPVEALRARARPGIEGRARLRWLTVVALVVAGAGIALWPYGSGETGLLAPLAVYGLLLLVALVSPFLLAPLGRIAGLPFAALFGVEERLARGALARDRSRTALTVGALTIGLALVVAIGTVALEARRSATAWIEGVLPGDVLLTTVTPVSLGEDGPIPEIAAVAGVERVSPLAAFPLAYEGVRLDASAVSGADMAADGRLTLVEGDRSTALAALDAGGSIVLPRAQAERLGLGLGERMLISAGSGGPTELVVAGIVERGLPGRGGEAVLVGWTDATERFGVAGADALAVRYEPGAASTAAATVAEAAAMLGLQPVALEEIESAVSDALDRVFGLFDVLALVAVVVAALGIVNTLTMDVVERIREIGILRAVGMTRRQVGRMVVVEAGILGLVGALLGIAAGLGVAVVMLVLAGGGIGPSFALPWSTLALALLLGVGLAMLAAWYPARLASRLTIVRAVEAE